MSNETEATELLPCPFCGGEPYTRTTQDGELCTHNIVDWHFVGCSNCEVSFGIPNFYDCGTASEQWNTRADLSDAKIVEAEQRGYAKAMDAERKDAEARIAELEAELTQKVEQYRLVGMDKINLVARVAELEAKLAKDEQFNALAQAHSDWSQATFGSDQERDHTGPLAHIKKEIEEIAAAPHDGSEWADGLLLLLDGARRAGFPADLLLAEAKAKLAINIDRTWGAPNEDGSVEHVRATLEELKGTD